MDEWIPLDLFLQKIINIKVLCRNLVDNYWNEPDGFYLQNWNFRFFFTAILRASLTLYEKKPLLSSLFFKTNISFQSLVHLLPWTSVFPDHPDYPVTQRSKNHYGYIPSPLSNTDPPSVRERYPISVLIHPPVFPSFSSQYSSSLCQ